jgi:hypothetical protein
VLPVKPIEIPSNDLEIGRLAGLPLPVRDLTTPAGLIKQSGHRDGGLPKIESFVKVPPFSTIGNL